MAPSPIDSVGVGDHQVGVDLQAGAEAVAVDAHAERAVERERLRRQLGQADAAGRDRRAPRCRRARSASPSTAASIEPPPALTAVSTESVRRARSLGVDGHAGRSRSRWCASSSCRARSTSSSRWIRPSMRTRAKPALRASSNTSRNSPLRFSALRRQQRRPCVFGRQRQQLVDDLGRRAGGDLAAAQVAALLAGARVEHAQVVVDLGDRADRRARVRRRRLLLDGDGRRQPAQLVVAAASPSAPGTAGRRTTATRRSGAAPRRTACRTPATTCPIPTRR